MNSDLNSKAYNGFISIVVPAFNEQEVLPAFHERLTKVLDALPFFSEILYVNDGSWDGTLEVMRDPSRP